MRGKRLISDYFQGRKSYLRQYVENVKPGEVLKTQEIVSRSGIPRTKVYSLMNLLEKWGMVEDVPFVWPEPPEVSEYWNKRRWAAWRHEVASGNYPHSKRWRFIGFIIAPVGELLKVARLDVLSLEDNHRRQMNAKLG